MSGSYSVRFTRWEREGQFSTHETLLDAAQALGVTLPAICGGSGTCGKCRVKILSGAPPPTSADRERLSADELDAGIRLACCTVIEADMVVQGPEPELSLAPVLTRGTRPAIELQPDVRKKFIQLSPPGLEDNAFDYEDLLEGAGIEARSVETPIDLLTRLPGRLRAANYQGTVVTCGGHLLDFEAGDTTERCFGFAVDLGTTTVVAKLVDLRDGRVRGTAADINPQRDYGEDVISRLSYARTHGIAPLQKAAIGILNHLFERALKNAGQSPESVYQIVVAGNTVMQHLLAGLEPRYLAESPYVPVTRGPMRLAARDLDFNVHPDARVYVFPTLGRYVGGDTAAVLLALRSQIDRSWLALDIGTNGEILLSHRGRIYCCSTAAGPAFEGGRIGCGMRASRGAIDRISRANGRWDLHVMGGGEAKGVCGSGLLDAMALFLEMNLIDETGRIVSGSGDEIALCDQVAITQRDIRELQLAKSAMATGVGVLLRRARLDPQQLDACYLSGAFGQVMRPQHAQSIGLLPDVALERILFIGNAACSGAEIALLSSAERSALEALSREVEHAELSIEPDFHDLYAENMMFKKRE